MKKIIMTFAAILGCAMTLMAEPILPKAARQAAAKFFEAKGCHLTSEAMRAKSRIQGEQSEASTYYVFNAADRQGFVVVSGDDCVGDNLVLGYAVQGSFDAQAVPSNMQYWLDEMENQVASLSRKGVKAKVPELHEDIDPMVTALWDQGTNIYNPKNPYNALCPEEDGKLCVTGCMATALAQVLYYHRWPQEPIAAPLPAYTTWSGLNVEELPVTTFDWQNMVDDYNEETTEEAQYAVAKLMRYCGQSFQMGYTPRVSSGYYYDADVLIRVFGYDQDTHQVCSDRYTVSGWDMLIYNELKEGRPVVHGGYSSGGGHAFVLDGYQVQDGNGYFHINWGWGGSDNGYFKISLLDPSAHGTGASTTSDGYSSHQTALIGLKPATHPLENYGRYLYAPAWNEIVDNELNSFLVVNTSYYPGSFAIHMAERADDGSLNLQDFAHKDTIDSPGYDPVNFSSWISFKLSDSFDGLAAGWHELVFVYKEVGTDAPWKPLFGPNDYVEVLIDEEGQLAETIVHPVTNLSTTLSKIKVSGIMQRGLRLNATLPITNDSDDDYMGAVKCTVYELSNSQLGNAVYSTMAGLMIEAGETQTVVLPLSIPVSGHLVMVLTRDEVTSDLAGIRMSAVKNASGYIGHKILDIEELVFYCDGITYTEETDEEDTPAYYLNAVLGNGTGKTYDAVVLAKIYKKNDEGTYDPVVFPSTPYLYSNFTLPTNTWGQVSITLPEPLESGDYGIELLIANDFKSRMPNDYFVFAAKLINVVSHSTGIRSMDNGQWTMDNEGWYDLNGCKLIGKPAVKGVYIHNGKKELIK